MEFQQYVDIKRVETFDLLLSRILISWQKKKFKNPPKNTMDF